MVRSPRREVRALLAYAHAIGKLTDKEHRRRSRGLSNRASQHAPEHYAEGLPSPGFLHGHADMTPDPADRLYVGTLVGAEDRGARDGGWWLSDVITNARTAGELRAVLAAFFDGDAAPDGYPELAAALARRGLWQQAWLDRSAGRLSKSEYRSICDRLTYATDPSTLAALAGGSPPRPSADPPPPAREAPGAGASDRPPRRTGGFDPRAVASPAPPDAPETAVSDPPPAPLEALRAAASRPSPPLPPAPAPREVPWFGVPESAPPPPREVPDVAASRPSSPRWPAQAAPASREPRAAEPSPAPPEAANAAAPEPRSAPLEALKAAASRPSPPPPPAPPPPAPPPPAPPRWPTPAAPAAPPPRTSPRWSGRAAAPASREAAAPAPRDGSHLRISTADRQRAGEALAVALADGRLGPAEYGERLQAVHAAKTYGDLLPLVRHLDALASDAEREPVIRAVESAGRAGALDPAEKLDLLHAARTATTDAELARLSAVLRSLLHGAEGLLANPRLARVADADRDRVVRRLQAAIAEGRLTLDEYDDRVRQTYAARRFADFEAVLGDLPEPEASPPFTAG